MVVSTALMIAAPVKSTPVQSRHGLIGLAGIAITGRNVPGDSLYTLFVLSGLIEVLSIFIFGYNMIMTLFIVKNAE